MGKLEEVKKMEQVKAYYDPATGWLYQTDINPPESIPASAIELTGGPAERVALHEGRAAGQVIELDHKGCPCLKDAPPPTDDQLRQAALGPRSMLMAQAATAIAPLQDAVDLGIATAAESAKLVEWKRYRVLLLRVDEQKGFPKKVDWPTQPE